LLIPLVSTITAIISLSTWIHDEVTNENEVPLCLYLNYRTKGLNNKYTFMSLHLKIYIITITIWLLCLSTSTTYNCLTCLKMSNHSRSFEVNNDTDDIVSGHATDASRSNSRNDDSLEIHQHNDGWRKLVTTNMICFCLYSFCYGFLIVYYVRNFTLTWVYSFPNLMYQFFSW
jgi:hypothetical protein